MVDKATQQILDDSFKRVTNLLGKKDKELRALSKYLYQHDYLNQDEMDLIIRGKGLGKEKDKNKVRTWDTKKYGNYLIHF